MTDESLKRILRVFLWLLGIAASAYLMYMLSNILVLLALSILLAFIFDPFVSMLEKEGLSRFLSTLIIFVFVGIGFYLILSTFIPKFIYQLNQLVETLQVYPLHDQLAKIEKGIYKYLPFFNPGDLSKKIEQFISTGITNSLDRALTLITSIVSIIAIVVIVPFITFFIVKDNNIIVQGLLHIVPNKYFEMSYWILKKVSIQLGRFVRGWIFDATFVGLACGFGYYFLGIQNALPLGVISGLGHLVPYFGPVFGAVPAIIISIIQYGDLSQIPFIILLVLTVYATDNGFVQPYVFAKSVDMHPIAIILLILAGSQFWGVIGMLLAVPLATVVKTLATEIYYALKNYKIARL